MEYRKEIDGLRAIAVIPVVFFHAGFEFFAGGYVGVDVFFVISGYLITSIIIKEMAEGKFTIMNFYERRARRILPALFFVMIACMPFAWVLMAPHQLKDFSQSLVATTFFSSNLFFFLESDYFNELSEQAPLLHTWSLAVEEQYYLLFPPFIIMTWTLGKKVIFALLALIFAVSLIISQWLIVVNTAANFYLLPSRAWEILIGVFLAFYLSSSGKRSELTSKLPSEILGFTGLLLIVFSILYFDEHTPFPGLWALFPTMGTALIILFATQNSKIGTLLSFKPIVGFGLISYSLYLWHQPLFAFARIVKLGDVTVVSYLLLSLIAVLLAFFSYKFIESPFRSRKRIGRRGLLAGVAAYAVIFPSLGLMGHFNDGFLNYKVSRVDPALRGFIIDRDQELRKMRLVRRELLTQSSTPFNSTSNQKKVLVLGDSKSQDLFIAFELNSNLFQDFQFRRVRLDDGCMNTFGNTDLIANLGRTCAEEFGYLESTGLMANADAIILSTTWRLFSNDSVEAFVRSVSEHYGRKILILGTGNFNDLTSLSMLIAKNGIRDDELDSFLYNNIRMDQRRAYLELKEKTNDIAGVTHLEKLELFCDFDGMECNLFSQDGVPYIYDSGHVTVEGAIELGRRIFDAGWLDTL